MRIGISSPAKQIVIKACRVIPVQYVHRYFLNSLLFIRTPPRHTARSTTEAPARVEKYLHATAIQKSSIRPEDITNRVFTLLQQHPQITRQDIFDCVLVRHATHGIRRIYTITASISPLCRLEVLTP